VDFSPDTFVWFFCILLFGFLVSLRLLNPPGREYGGTGVYVVASWIFGERLFVIVLVSCFVFKFVNSLACVHRLFTLHQEGSCASAPPRPRPDKRSQIDVPRRHYGMRYCCALFATGDRRPEGKSSLAHFVYKEGGVRIRCRIMRSSRNRSVYVWRGQSST
jgi:hypothetical protein